MVYGSPGYFRTLRPSQLEGRDFGPEDRSDWGRGLVAIVNKAAARVLWPGVVPLGRRLVLEEFVFQAEPVSGARTTCRNVPSQPTPVCTHPVRVAETTVIGIVDDMVLRRIGETPRPTVYLPLSQWRGRAGSLAWTGVIPLVVRTDRPGATRQLGADALGVWRAPVESVVSISDAVDEMTGPQQLARSLLLWLAATMMLVTLTGVYASAHLSVVRNQRSHALRLAFGASAPRLVLSSVAHVTSTFWPALRWACCLSGGRIR